MDTDMIFTVVLTASGVAFLIAAAMYFMSRSSEKSSRPAGMLAAVASLLYLGGGMAGAKARVDAGPAKPAPQPKQAEPDKPKTSTEAVPVKPEVAKPPAAVDVDPTAEKAPTEPPPAAAAEEAPPPPPKAAKRKPRKRKSRSKAKPTPAAEPKEEPAAEPAAEPKEEPAAEPKDEPAAEPKEEPAAEPKDEPHKIPKLGE